MAEILIGIHIPIDNGFILSHDTDSVGKYATKYGSKSIPHLSYDKAICLLYLTVSPINSKAISSGMV